MSKDETVDVDKTFEALKDAVMRSPRGRWFLEEYARRNRVADTQMILDRLDKVTVAGGGPANDQRIEYLHSELRQMAAQIVETRQEIAAIKPSEGGNNRIMAATEELDAIISSTERATAEILTHAEKIQELAEKMREDGVDEETCEYLEQQVTQIFMACSFQDITGQRTTKVVNVLRYLEARINGMIRIWGEERDAAGRPTMMLRPDDQRPDAHLLHGPQNEAFAISQDEVDRMLNEEGGSGDEGSGGDASEQAPQDKIDSLFR